MADINEKIDADLTRMERDRAVADAAKAEAERDAIADVAVDAVIDRDKAQTASAINADAANAARVWGAQNAASRASAEHQAIESEAKAQSNAAAFWLAAGVIIILVVGWIIWDLNQPKPSPAVPAAVVITRPAPSTGVTNPGPAASYVTPPPASSSTVNITPAPSSAPAATGTSSNSTRTAPPAQPPVVINNNIPAQPASPSSSAPAASQNTPDNTSPGNGSMGNSTNSNTPAGGTPTTATGQ